MKPGLTLAKAAQNNTMDLSGVRRRVTKTSDGHGGFTETYTDSSAIACNLGGPSGESERVIASKLTDSAHLFLTVPVGTDIKIGDFWVMSSKRYKVIWVESNISYLTAIRCLVIDDDTRV